jgi:tetratricopeptide (TPR) repeat protein
MLADVLVRLGRRAEAQAELDRAEDLTSRDDKRNLSRVRTVRARTLLAQGDQDGAARELGEARRLAGESGARRYEIEFADLEGSIAFARGDMETARARWGWIARTYWDETGGDDRFDEYLNKISLLPR